MRTMSTASIAHDGTSNAAAKVTKTHKAHGEHMPKRKTHKAFKDMTKEEKKDAIIRIVGLVASVMSVIMYVSYIPQIAANLSGNPGVVWQPLAAFFNCVFWSVYGIWTKPRQWPVIIANVPGIFLTAFTVATCIIH